MLELKGDFPNVHERFKYKNLSFEIMKKEQHRISRIKVTKEENSKLTN